jgi:hypothetical protein
MIESTTKTATYKAEKLIVTFGCVKKAIEYQKNVVKSLNVEQYTYNLNTYTLYLLERFDLEKERGI